MIEMELGDIIIVDRVLYFQQLGDKVSVNVVYGVDVG